MGGMASRAIWARRARHPSWWLRLAWNWARVHYLWRQQGCPRDVPVVIHPGVLLAAPDGKRGQISGWAFDCRFQTRPVTADDLWERLSAMHPVTRAEHLPASGPYRQG
jgi:hypothetical protein